MGDGHGALSSAEGVLPRFRFLHHFPMRDLTESRYLYTIEYLSFLQRHRTHTWNVNGRNFASGRL